MQRKCACSGTSSACEGCGKDEPALHRRAVDGARASQAVTPGVQRVLNSAGRPLDASVRSAMQPHFGHDFSRVSVHTDERAAESAASVGALAYTVGRHVVFGAGQFAPATTAGRRLLAHELAHVVQQSSSPSFGLQRQPASPGAGDDELEREADTVADRVVVAGNDEGTPAEKTDEKQPKPEKPAHRANSCTRTILSEGTCADLVAKSKYICCDPENGIERPERDKDIEGKDCPSHKFTPIFTCDNKCKNALAKGCSDDDNWMALPPKSFSRKACGDVFTICANGKKTTAYVRDHSVTRVSFEVSPKVQKDLGVAVGSSFKGAVYRPGAKAATIDKDACCNGT
ncbi:MAG: hypothetical protein JWM87_255 [Candidatus Eremiobacteraeota bacterium]|nr:hypothetical protein [Candidatus Eremiobacteraeota bacterium]